MLDLVRSLPPIHELQKTDSFIKILNQYNIPYNQLSSIVKNEMNTIRNSILASQWEGDDPSSNEFISSFFELIEHVVIKLYSSSLKKVINATGTILHTNIGRALLSEEAAAHVVETSLSYTNLEYDIEKGARSERHSHVERLIKKITGAEAAIVVNNNAAAVYFILNVFARNREVIVSRGELVEIGGSFRVSSIMEESGAKLVEVGTTNRTHLFDYERAINEETAMMMKVHTSNFTIKGFTASVQTDALANLKQQHPSIILYEDLGSGVLIDLQSFGIGNEPVISHHIRNGADLVSFSGDKLLGGPQAGIIAGKKELIDVLKKNQLSRVLRVDKMTIAALEATLLHYIKGEALSKIPALQSIMMEPNTIKNRIEVFTHKLLQRRNDFELAIKEDTSRVGGGTMPEVELPTYLLGLKHKIIETDELEKLLRKGPTSILARIQQDELLFDFRTVKQEEEKILLEELSKIPGHI